MNPVNNPVNVYGVTEYYEGGVDIGILDAIHDGLGYRDDAGHITWYDGYEPLEDENHTTFIWSYGGGCDISEILGTKPSPQVLFQNERSSMSIETMLPKRAQKQQRRKAFEK